MADTTQAVCTCHVCLDVRTVLQQILRVVDVYGWILDAYVVDFFEDELWSKLPNKWAHVLQDVSPEEFGRWITGESVYKCAWPLSLLALRKVIKILQLKRDHVNSLELACENNSEGYDAKRIKCTERIQEISKHNNLFKKHVKIKKQYEIDQIAQVCAKYAQKSQSRCVVDIGAGMGHLARVLSFQYELNVICVEQEPVLSARAKKWDYEFLHSIRKHIPNFNVTSPYHLSVKVETSSKETNVIDSLHHIFTNEFNLKYENSKFGFIGLHPCGDLAATLLRLYLTRDEARFICIVGCCYMKLTLQPSTNNVQGYPLSQYVMDLKNHKLSYAALEVACHAIEKHCDQLKTGDQTNLIVHAYRAALETILLRKSLHLRRIQLKNVKVKKHMTFEQYTSLVTSDLKIEFHPTLSDVTSSEIGEYLTRWRQVVIFGSLRVMLAPLIETIVLLDRFLFLSEKRLNPVLRPIFNPKLSPRNFVLLSAKTTL